MTGQGAKQKELVILVAVLIVSIIISILVSGLFFNSSKRDQQVGVVDKITADFPVSQVQGSNKQFNGQAFNPAQIINIGQTNNQPFANSSQPQ